MEILSYKNGVEYWDGLYLALHKWLLKLIEKGAITVDSSVHLALGKKVLKGDARIAIPIIEAIICADHDLLKEERGTYGPLGFLPSKSDKKQ